jgi:aryl-alcohol dehydrogenase-like predicted oxidoreductase
LGGEIPEGSRAKGNERLEQRLREHLPTMQKLGEWAHARDLTLSQLALAWLLHQPAMVSPIIGASRPEQVRENASASQVKLSHDDLQHIESILQPASTDTEQGQIAMLV